MNRARGWRGVCGVSGRAERSRGHVQAFGPMSATMVNRDSVPEVCVPLLARYPNESGTCFKMDIIAAPGYFFTIVAVFIFLLTGFDGSPTHK